MCLEENTVTNRIAKFVFDKEKCNARLQKSVQDEFEPEYENFLFKDNQDEDDMAFIDDLQTTDFYEEFYPEDTCSKEMIGGEKPNENTEKPKANKLSKNKKQKLKEKATVVAPGENQKFDNKFKHLEERCFPTLFPKGEGGYASTYLETGLGISNYCKLRLTGGICVDDDDKHAEIKQIEEDSCVDYERFRRDHHYMMFLLLICDSINMRRAQETAFRKVTRSNKYRVDNMKVTEENRAMLERRNIGYRTFKHIRGTAPYFEHSKSRLFAFLRQNGPPTIFTTITSAEYDWTDLMINIIESKPDARRIEDIIQAMKQKHNLSHLLNFENKEQLREHAEEIVSYMEGPEMSKLVNDHIVHTTKDFDERIKYLFRLFKLPGFFDKEKMYKISDYFIRIEHQQRGAPHAHILLWMVYQSEFIDRTVYINGEEKITQENKPAPNFRNCVYGKRGQEKEEGKRILENFADKLITIKIDESEEDVLKYQTHKHTFTCTKKKKNRYFLVKEDEGFGKNDGKMKGLALKTPKCRFHFPRFPMRKTTLLEPLVEAQPNVVNENSAPEFTIKKADINLNRIRKFMLRNLFQEKTEETASSRQNFFELSFDRFLEELGINETDYILALRRSVNGRGVLFLKRECSQVFYNNFNKNIMSQHSANQDFTLCIDEFQVAAYVANYLTKNEAGQSNMLREVDEQCEKEGISYSEKLKKFAAALDQSREVSVQVCYIVKNLYSLAFTFTRKLFTDFLDFL